jgi:hypothetical protein
MPLGDEFHKYEVVDRAHSVFVLLGELLMDHPMVECDPELKAAYEKAADALYALYSAAGAKYL